MKRFTYGSPNTLPRYWSSCGQLSSSCANAINIGGSPGLTRSEILCGAALAFVPSSPIPTEVRHEPELMWLVLHLLCQDRVRFLLLVANSQVRCIKILFLPIVTRESCAALQSIVCHCRRQHLGRRLKVRQGGAFAYRPLPFAQVESWDVQGY